MKLKHKILFGLLLTILAIPVAMATQSICAHDERIQILGTKYITKTKDGLRFQRHREDILKIPRKELGVNPNKARNNSGILLVFKTDSKKIIARFDILSDSFRGTGLGVFENGLLTEDFKYRPKTEEAILHFNSKTDGTSTYEIALPSFADVEFKGLELYKDASLEKPQISGKKVYVALGDSISHGAGQRGATHKTWPFLLSRKLDMELFNLAVGGGKVSVPIAEMLEDWETIDLITILVGYNDLHFDGKTTEQYAEKYNELLDAVRKNHPDTEIYCITGLFTRKPVSKKTGIDIQQFRDALTELVKKRQESDKHLHLVKGDSITSEKNLRSDKPSDPVHLGIEGAAMLAEELSTIVKQDSAGME